MHEGWISLQFVYRLRELRTLSMHIERSWRHHLLIRRVQAIPRLLVKLLHSQILDFTICHQFRRNAEILLVLRNGRIMQCLNGLPYKRVIGP